jgi:hypothetical protein
MPERQEQLQASVIIFARRRSSSIRVWVNLSRGIPSGGCLNAVAIT